VEPHRLSRCLVGCLLLLTAMTGCGLWPPRASNDSTKLPGLRLDVPDGTIAVISWLPDGDIYLDWAQRLGTPHSILRITPGQAAERVELPQQAGCQRTDYMLPHRLPDGRLGLARKCITDDPSGIGYTLIGYRPASGRIDDLARVGQNLPRAVSWRRTMDSGYLSTGSGICDGFGPITRHGVGAFPGPVNLDGHTWHLDEIFRETGADSCTDQGRAGWAMLTPDNRQLIFTAAPDAQGASGQSRLDVPSHIYRQDLPAGRPGRLVSGFDDLTGMDMSPDGRLLAVAGRRGRERGLWLVNLGSGDQRKVAGGPLIEPSFSPDGRRLAVVFNPKPVEKAQLRVLDVPT
jgi:WD40-like Beta Propeller Repeat